MKKRDRVSIKNREREKKIERKSERERERERFMRVIFFKVYLGEREKN